MLTALCRKVACRGQTRPIELRLDASRGYHFESELLPYVDDKGSILLYPGDVVTVSVARNGKKLSLPKIVNASDAGGKINLGGKANSGATSTVTFALTQDEGKPDMTLLVTNKTGLTLKYTAVAGIPSQQGLRPSHTSVCPLLPGSAKDGFTGHETWPQAIGMIILSDLRIVQSKDTACN